MSAADAVRVALRHRELEELVRRVHAAALPPDPPPPDRDVFGMLEATRAALERGTGPPAPAPAPDGGGVDDLIALRDMAEGAVAGDGDAREAARVLLERLEQALQRRGVRVLAADGEFDPRAQEILELRPTSDPALDRHVCATVRPGYAAGERVLRPQQVVVYRLEA